MERASVRAARRLKVAEIAATHFEGRVCPERGFYYPTWDEIRETLRDLMAHGALALGSLPTTNTLAAWAHKWMNGHRAVADYEDKPGRGRRCIPLHPEIRDEIHRLKDSGQHRTHASVVAAIEAFARTQGLEVPSPYRVYEELRRYGLVREIAARQGSKAAFLDGMPHCTYVASEPHEVAMLDEMLWPTYAQGLDAQGQRVSLEPWLILMDDAMSSAVLSYHLCDPTRRRRADGAVHTTGFDGDDVLTTLVGAAIPEMAPGACREIAGFLPDTLRFDNAQQHKGLLSVLAHVTGMKVPTLPMHSPEDRALIEARVHRMKLLAEGLPYQRDHVIPVDRLPSRLQSREVGTEVTDEELVEGERFDEAMRLEPRANTAEVLKKLNLERTRMAANGQRTTRRTIVRVEDLPTLGELRAHIDRRVRAYNYDLPHSRLGLPPAAAHRFHRDPQRRRNGAEILRAIPTRSVQVDTKGIAVALHGRETRYAFEVNGWMAMVGQSLTVRVHPLGHCLFFAERGTTQILRPLPEYGKDMDLQQLKQSLELGPRIYSKMASELQQATYGAPPEVEPTPPPPPAPSSRGAEGPSPAAVLAPTRETPTGSAGAPASGRAPDPSGAPPTPALAGTQAIRSGVPTRAPDPLAPMGFTPVRRSPDAQTAPKAKSALDQVRERMRASQGLSAPDAPSATTPTSTPTPPPARPDDEGDIFTDLDCV